MHRIELASSNDGPVISRLTEMAGVFTSTEVKCVEELWSLYRDSGEPSGYAFLVCRDEYG
jgi:hypothetical protein